MSNIITTEQLNNTDDSFLLIDIRDETAFEYGHINGAVNIPQERIFSEELPRDKKLVIYCKSGIISGETADKLCEMGYDAYDLQGGYVDWLRNIMENRQLTEQVELSLRKKFKKSIWCKFTKAINEYELVRPNDRIAVCISGGKDSMLMAKLFQELKRHDKFPFEVVFLVMDPGYSPENRRIIEKNAESMSIPITIFESDIFDSVYNIEKNPCYICARMRRGYLYNKAKELGCNKIALGHHFDDVIETILMGMLYGGQVQTMMPKLHSTNFEGMELIRPLYLVREDEIKHWRDYNGLHFIQCACKFTDTCTTCDPDSRSVSKRLEIKNLIAEMKKVNPQVEKNIFRSVENVNLSTVIAYKEGGVVHRFTDDYDSRS
ncbi:MAG: ATPase [Ruminococcus sp.]|nr:ATPase [Ruminococcus sp.]